MTALTSDELYSLLPALHRVRDAGQGEPLRALLALAAEQGALVEHDIARLLDNWFIETCDEWVVPYIGDLLGVRGVHALPTSSGFSQRARVANMIAYRRRKGTATMLEQLARDTTGWPARAVEFFQILGWNQNYNHVRPQAHRTPDLRRTNELELLDTAFDTAMHTVDVRRIEEDRGRHNLPNIGLFLWRLQAYHLGGVSAFATAPAGFYTFSPLGLEQPLFNRPQTETEITHLAEEINVPGALRRRPLHDELEARRAALAAGATPVSRWFRAQPGPVLQVHQQIAAGDPFVPIPPEKIRIAHLGPGATRPAPGGVVGDPEILVGVDPVLGRFAWADGLTPPHALAVDYAYGFSGDLGGGPYDRSDSVEVVLQQRATPKLGIDWHVGVSQDLATVAVNGESIFRTLADAIAAWHAAPAGLVGVITIMDNRTYAENLSIEIPEGSRLLIAAANWPIVAKTGGGSRRITGQLEPRELRPHVRGNIKVVGTAPDASTAPGLLALDGLLIEGALEVGVKGALGNLGTLRVAHSTLVPTEGGLAVTAKNTHLSVQLARTICGPIALVDGVPALTLEDCIVDAAGATKAIDAPDSAVDVQSSTIFGRTTARRFDAGNTLFTRRVDATRRQEGCVRFCYLPPESNTGRRYRCQPELALATAEAAAKADGGNLDAAEENAVLTRVVPMFVSEVYGQPTYAQLAQTCAPELRTGAEDGAEMGAFRFLQQPQREANLRTSLDEFLRFGLEAGLIFAT